MTHHRHSHRRHSDRRPGPRHPVPAVRGSRPPRVDVLVIGARTRASSLARHLPDDWRVRRADAVTTAAEADLLVVYDATGPTVAVALRRHPAASVLGVVASGEPVDVMVDVLEAGADACVRESAAAVITGHLMACHRRRLTAHRASGRLR